MIIVVYILLGLLVLSVIKYFVDTKPLTLADLIKLKSTPRQSRNLYWLRNKQFKNIQGDPNCRILKRTLFFRETETLKYPGPIEEIKGNEEFTSHLSDPLTYLTPEADFVEFEPHPKNIREQLLKAGFLFVRQVDTGKEQKIGHHVIEQQIERENQYFIKDFPVEFYYGETLAACLNIKSKAIEIYDRP